MDALQREWEAAWPRAVALWSPFAKLSEPRWCRTREEESREELTGSFAMIRLFDHAVVVSLRQVQEKKLERFALEILAHEVGHHIYTPADLTDAGRMLARIRRALPTLEHQAPMVANLYEDLLINDRLKRVHGLLMEQVFLTLGTRSPWSLWTLYMRIYEILWALTRGTLVPDPGDPVLEGDAQLGARLIRSYA
ncbi:MAG: VWA domain-containing protein, partial [Candidatus Eremiobacterota bacterium]